MRWRTLAVVALLVCAGCSSLVDGGEEPADPATSAATMTPAPVPATTPTPERWPVTPGLSARGVVDVDALARAHQAATEGHSYVWREWRGSGAPGASEANATDANGSVPLALVQRARVEREDTYAYWAEHQVVYLGVRTRHRYNYSEYVVDGVGYARLPSVEWDTDGPIPLQAAAANRRIGGEAATAIRRYLAVGTANATVSRTTLDGRPAYRVRATHVPIRTVDPVSNGSVSALVTPEGFVRSLSVAYTTRGFDGPRRVRYRFAYDRVGETTVDPPDWVPE